MPPSAGGHAKLPTMDYELAVPSARPIELPVILTRGAQPLRA